MLVTLQAGTTATPDPALATDGAVTTLTAGGHVDSSVQDLGPGAAQLKSARWSGYSLTGQVTKAVVKFDWAITAGGANTDISLGGSASADASFNVTLSVDGGATFPTGLLSRSVAISGDDSASLIESGSVSFEISPVPTIGQIAIRDRMRANAVSSGGGVASALVTAHISNLRLEVTTIDPQPICIW